MARSYAIGKTEISESKKHAINHAEPYEEMMKTGRSTQSRFMKLKLS